MRLVWLGGGTTQVAVVLRPSSSRHVADTSARESAILHAFRCVPLCQRRHDV